VNLDIRIPIGSMFGILGALLFLYGLDSDSDIYRRSLGINVNLIWGAVMLVFGLVMLGLSRFAARAASRRLPRHEPSPMPNDTRRD
jgi:hypothetical protein